jgi:NADH-quinone oxidoreductase subunit E
MPVNPFPAPLDRELDLVVARYPRRQAAMLPVLTRLQAERGHLTDETLAEVAQYLEVPEAYVQGVVSFYSMYDRGRTGRHKVYVCKTLSCHLRGAKEVLAALEKRFGVGAGGTTADGKYTLVPFECLGLCEMAPCMIAGDRRWGNLTGESAVKALEELP